MEKKKAYGADRKIPVQVLMDQDLIRKLDARCHGTDQSRSSLIREILGDALDA